MFQCHRDEHERNERDSEQQIKKRAQLRHVKCFPMEYRDMLHMRETKQSECQCGKQKHPFHHRHGRQGFFFRHEEGRKPKHHADENRPHDDNRFRQHYEVNRYLNIGILTLNKIFADNIKTFPYFIALSDVRMYSLLDIDSFCSGRKAFSAE